MVRGFRIEPRPIIELDPDEVGTGPKGLPGDKGPDGDPSTVPGPPGPGLPPGVVGEDEGKLLIFTGPGDRETAYQDFLVGPSIIAKSMIGEVDVEGTMVSEVAGGAPSPVTATARAQAGTDANSATYGTGIADYLAPRVLVGCVVSDKISGGASIPNLPTNANWDFEQFPGATLLGDPDNNKRMTLFRAATPGLGEWGDQPISLPFPATQDGAAWGFVELDNVSLLGTNGSGAFASAPVLAKGNSTTPAVTLPGSPGTVAVLAFAAVEPARTVTPGAGYTLLFVNSTGGQFFTKIAAEFRDTPATAVSFSLNAASNWICGAVEIIGA